MSNKQRTSILLFTGLLVMATVAAGSAAALAPEDPTTSVSEAGEPAPSAPVAEQRRVAEDEFGDEGAPAEFIAPPPEDMIIEPPPVPVTTLPPKIDSAQFGVGWPAAAAVGVALAAVLVMALMWRRDEV